MRWIVRVGSVARCIVRVGSNMRYIGHGGDGGVVTQRKPSGTVYEICVSISLPLFVYTSIGIFMARTHMHIYIYTLTKFTLLINWIF